MNVGWGEDTSILDLARLVQQVVGFEGEIELDADKPDGTPKKLVDTARRSSLGWNPTIGLKDGIESTYQWYVANSP